MIILKNNKINNRGVHSDNKLSKELTEAQMKKNSSLVFNFKNKELKKLWIKKRQIKADKNFKRIQNLNKTLKKFNISNDRDGIHYLKNNQELYGIKLNKLCDKNINLLNKFGFKNLDEANNYFKKFINLPKIQSNKISKREYKEILRWRNQHPGVINRPLKWDIYK